MLKAKVSLQQIQENNVFIFRQYQQFMKLDEYIVKDSIESNDFRIRLAATLVAGERYMFPLKNDMIDLLVEKEIPVQQAARRSLMILSAKKIEPKWSLGKNTERFVDFGPTPSSTTEQARASQRLWNLWWSKQE